MPRLSRSPLAIVALATMVGAVLLGGGGAWAAWTVAGGGTGTTTGDSLVTPLVTATRSTTAPTTAIDLSWAAPGQLPGATYSVTRNGAAYAACTASPCTDSGLTPGTSYTYVVTAKLGTSWTVASSPATASTGVAAVSTTTSVSSSQNPARTGATVTLTATVTSGSGTPTGSVTFKDGTADITCTGGTAPTLSGGSATCQTSFTTTGAHSVTALYSGASGFAASTSTALTQRIVNGAVTGLAFTNVKADNVSVTPTCTGVGTGSVACSISGTGNSAVVTTDAKFVNSTGVATAYATDVATSLPWSGASKGNTNSGTISVSAGGTSGGTASITKNGSNSATITVTLNDAGNTFTATLTVN